MKKITTLLLSFAITFGYGLSLQADDTDIYFLSNPDAAGAPLIMFMLDRRASTGSNVCNGSECDFLYNAYYCDGTDAANPCATPKRFLPAKPTEQYKLLIAVLKYVLTNLSTPANFGLMLSHTDENGCVGFEPKQGNAIKKCSNGGYIPLGFRAMPVSARNAGRPVVTGNMKTLFDKLDGIPVITQGTQAHPNQLRENYLELYRYLTGGGLFNAKNGWIDFGTTNTQNIDADAPAIVWDTSIMNGDQNAYIKPDFENCSRVYVINIASNTVNQDDQSDSTIQTDLGISFTGGQNTKRELVLSTLYNVDLSNTAEGKQNITSYLVVNNPQNTEHGYAQAGGSQLAYDLNVSPAELVATFDSILKEILSTSATFVAASVPVNIINQNEVINNVFVALFQVDPDGYPRWPGNLKKVILNDTRTALIDVLGNKATSSTDGRLSHSALTFWTDAATLPPPNLAENEVAGRDGRAVRRGGAGQKIPGYVTGAPEYTNATSGARQLFTEPSGYTNGTPVALMPLNADDTTASDADIRAKLGIDTSLSIADQKTAALTELKYIRGYKYDTASSTWVKRNWMFGDPLHSRPLPVNYGARGSYTDTNQDIRVILGSNDGFMRMIRNTNADGTESGVEVWGFMPRSVLPIQPTLRVNTATVPVHPYGVDGVPAIYTKDVNNDNEYNSADNDIVWLYFGMRRGGRALYSLDISDPDTPKTRWQITNATSGFSELGLTFSTPQVDVLDYGSGTKPVLIFGGGYDTNKDASGVGTDDTIGNALYIVDAETGTLVWKASQGSGGASATGFEHPDLSDSVPADASIADTNGDGLIDRVYFVDTGGVAWRVDIPGNDRTQWTVSKLFSVGRHNVADATNDRRFFYPPDIVKAQDSTGVFYAIVVGTGDREHPLERNVENWTYMYKDRVGIGGSPATTSTHSSFGDVTDNCLQTNSCTVDPDLAIGWRLKMETEAEKVLTSAQTFGGVVFFSTYVPAGVSELTCGPKEGDGYLYAVSLQSAFAETDLTGDGAPDRKIKTDTPGLPSDVVYLPGDPDTGAGPTVMGGSGERFIKLEGSGAWKTYWYQMEE